MTTPNDPQNQGQQQGGDLATELRELGQQIEQAVRSAITSDRAKQIQADVSSGMKEIGTQVQHAIKSIQENPRVQELAERGQQAVDKARESKAAQDFQETLARGIAQLNDQLAAFIQRMRDSDSAASAGDSAASAGDSAASTGETTRLDPDKQ